LADVLAANTDQGIDKVAERLLDVIFPVGDDTSRDHRSVGRRLIEILESDPDKRTLVEFLRANIARHLGWGTVSVIEKYELYGVGFDAYARYVGHGLRLALVNFTEVWEDPFETGRDGTLNVNEKISSALAAIEMVQDRFSRDVQSQARIRSWLAPEDSRLRAIFGDPEYFNSLVPELNFFVYAGRRSQVDVSPERHNRWSHLRNYRDNIVLRTYDNLIDAFL
jgi:hypothetical protein